MGLWDLFRTQYMKGKVIYKSQLDNGNIGLVVENQIDRILKNLIIEVLYQFWVILIDSYPKTQVWYFTVAGRNTFFTAIDFILARSYLQKLALLGA